MHVALPSQKQSLEKGWIIATCGRTMLGVTMRAPTALKQYCFELYSLEPATKGITKSLASFPSMGHGQNAVLRRARKFTLDTVLSITYFRHRPLMFRHDRRAFLTGTVVRLCIQCYKKNEAVELPRPSNTLILVSRPNSSLLPARN